MGIRRIYVEKKSGFSVKSMELRDELVHYLKLKNIERVRILIRYDIESITDATYQNALGTIFSEPPLDHLYEEEFPHNENDLVFAVEFLPGQFDQRADSAVQCVKILNENETPQIRSAVTYVITGVQNQEEVTKIKSYCINPVDSREADCKKPDTLTFEFEKPDTVAILHGFCDLSPAALENDYDKLNLAMTFEDLKTIQQYFKTSEKRDPSITEIRVLDTYWSDHCRHTTFQTELANITFAEGDYREPIEQAFLQYKNDRIAVSGDKYISLMDLALLAMKKLKKEGILTDVEESEEINACSIVVPVVIDGIEEEWLINFKNETHNHPTEIEPFGGAATCLGGAIRDPLSGRTYVYQAMRITGAADPRASLDQTLKGKLPQRKIVQGAADGYSSYGNQIGLATGYVKELYHPDYAAKRMEIGAVLGAAPRKHVIRKSSDPGDIIILLGGRTGRDGVGGATGSSKAHTESSIEVCGAEVQKGNAPTERKLQRLFRRPKVSLMIKKCNDFGAGGVAVAIGELADGLIINLDEVPKKYAGLDGTEIAISESQERMAVVVSPDDVNQMLAFAMEENLEAVVVAKVTDEARLVMRWQDQIIVDISRKFLDTNGAHQQAEALITMPRSENSPFRAGRSGDMKECWKQMLSDLNVCSQKGLVEMFDSSIGASSVFMPYGGKYQMSEIQTMAAKIPVLSGESDAVTMMSYGFDPELSSWSPFHGAVYAILTSVAKIAAVGGDIKKIHFTFQEYFRRMTADPKTWGEPLAALLGAYHAQMKLGLASIGGKDSMSGTFYDEDHGEINVPPTLVSFAVCVGSDKEICSPELKGSGHHLIWVQTPKDAYDLPDFEQSILQYKRLYQDIRSGHILSAYALEKNGIAEAVSKMAFGNRIGVELNSEINEQQLFICGWGDLICEVAADSLEQVSVPHKIIGKTIEKEMILYKDMELSLAEAEGSWKNTLEQVFPTQTAQTPSEIEETLFQADHIYICKHKVAKPQVFIPVFPGTNCEYDSQKAFEQAGADVSTKVFKNLTPQNIRDSIELYQQEIRKAQIVMFPGGFSAGDEPDGSAKFFSAVFRNEGIKAEIEALLQQRDGLILGICNGFQALIKLGLVPGGIITEPTAQSPTLARNTIGRHISKMVYTKVVSNQSPWLQKAVLGDVYCNPASHGEGRFIADKQWLETLLKGGQIATQYVDIDGNPSMSEEWNPNGSYLAIEGITSPDGRVFGKMAHAERIGKSVSMNIMGNQDLKIFESGVEYFK